MADVLSHLPETGISIFPLWPHRGEPAKRVLVRAKKSSAAPWRLLSGMVLHERDGGYTLEADRVLKGAKALDFESQ
jgi:tRNA1(Val) A37 N6-methylase TrmN6